MGLEFQCFEKVPKYIYFFLNTQKRKNNLKTVVKGCKWYNKNHFIYQTKNDRNTHYMLRIRIALKQPETHFLLMDLRVEMSGKKFDWSSSSIHSILNFNLPMATYLDNSNCTSVLYI